MKDKLLSLLRQHELLPRGSHVFCALSGGADSVAMSHCLLSLQEELGITLSLCHFNHLLRGAESDGDEAFCRQLAEAWGVPIHIGREDVLARARETGESLEEAARHCRYDFFETLDGIIATAHTADDQAETVLLHILRGTGLKGLGGIPVRRGKLVRPMLTISREEVEKYLLEHGLPHREDGTNQADDCVRNRLRHHVMPLLKQENPALLSTVTRMTQTLREDEAYLQEQANALLSGSPETGWAISPLQRAPAPLRRRALKTVFSLCPVPNPSAAHVLAAERVLDGSDPSASVHLTDGWVLQREYDRFFLVKSAPTATFNPVTLPCPGAVTVPELGITFRCRKTMEHPIVIRPRRAGDEIRLQGGTKTVKKLLIDKKIPAGKRELIPVLEQNGVLLSLWGIADAADWKEKTAITAEKERGNGL